MKKLFILLIILVIIAFAWEKSSTFFPNIKQTLQTPQDLLNKNESVKILHEENVVIDVVKNSGPSVVTIGIKRDTKPQNDPLSLFVRTPTLPDSDTQDTEDYIGSGFVIQKDGLIVTNKHVVGSASNTYYVFNESGEKFEVEKIYRDPLNDLAILKVKAPPGGFKEITLGSSTNLQVGQFVIAIGTALGEFRNTVTTGVISGLGRGITAGSQFEGFAERLDNVIQTDAAINPGNSGGPLLNSAGQVIGVTSAIAQNGQNIGFAIPINIVKDSLKNFNETGQFNRPYLGVAYNIISQRAALLNDVPEGALVQDVIKESAAEKAGIQTGDIITKIDGKNIKTQNGSVAAIISSKKIGDKISIDLYRDGKNLSLTATLEAVPEE